MNQKVIIVAIYPSYDKNGDGTNIIYSNGTCKRIAKSIQVCLQMFSEKLGIHIPTLRKSIYGRQLFSQPLPLDKSHILIPIKVRENPIGRDATFGYLNYYALSEFRWCKTDEKHLCFLFNNLKMRARCSVSTWQKKLSTAKYLHANQVAELNQSAAYTCLHDAIKTRI